MRPGQAYPSAPPAPAQARAQSLQEMRPLQKEVKGGWADRLKVTAVAVERLRAWALMHTLKQDWIQSTDLFARVLQVERGIEID